MTRIIKLLGELLKIKYIEEFNISGKCLLPKRLFYNHFEEGYTFCHFGKKMML